MQNTETIESERLVLRAWREDDAEALFRYASDSRVSEMALWPAHTSVEMSRQVIREFFVPNEHTFAMILKQTGEAIGCIGLVPAGDEHHATLPAEREAGYWVGFPHWNKGYTTEAMKALTAFCRDNLRLSSLLITTDARNTASQHVAEKCGFTLADEYDHEGTASKAYRLRLR